MRCFAPHFTTPAMKLLGYIVLCESYILNKAANFFDNHHNTLTANFSK